MLNDILRQDYHGYALREELKELCARYTGSTVYPILLRIAREGFARPGDVDVLQKIPGVGTAGALTLDLLYRRVVAALYDLPEKQQGAARVSSPVQAAAMLVALMLLLSFGAFVAYGWAVDCGRENAAIFQDCGGDE